MTTLWVPWARWEVLTPGGKLSAASRAGQQVPWLSINRIGHRMHHRQYQLAVAAWRSEALHAARSAALGPVGWPGPSLLLLRLLTATNHPLDPTAIVEGAKPLVDGLVEAGVLAGDTEAHVLGALGRSAKAPSRDETGVAVTVVPCPLAWLAGL
jgi:hypothetical protein